MDIVFVNLAGLHDDKEVFLWLLKFDIGYPDRRSVTSGSIVGVFTNLFERNPVSPSAQRID